MGPTVGATDQHHLFDVLSHQCRRHVLQVLISSEPPLTVTELAEKVHTKRTANQEGSFKQLDQLRMGLHHAHLPRMADANLLTYEMETKQIPAWNINLDLSEENRDLIRSLIQNSQTVESESQNPER